MLIKNTTLYSSLLLILAVPNVNATVNNSTALGVKATATNTNATALGYNTNATGMSSTALGSAAKANGYTSLALGYNSNASAANSIAIGSAAKSTTNDGIAIGTRTEVSQLYSIALGDGARATGDTLKDAAYLVKDDGPVGELNIGKYSGLNTGDKLGERRITGLAAGSHDTDAVNVSQLKHVDDKVETLEGKTQILEGKTQILEGKTQNLSDRTDLLEEADKLNVKYTENSQNSTIELLGNNGTVISNVANGKVESDSSEAINGSQLYSTKQALIDYTDTKFDSFNGRLDQLDNRFNKFNKETKAGIASAIAIASLPQPTEKGYSMLSLGTGVWEGETSVALGASGVTNDKKLLKKSVNYVWKFASTTNSQSNWGGGGSVGVQWK